MVDGPNQQALLLAIEAQRRRQALAQQAAAQAQATQQTLAAGATGAALAPLASEGIASLAGAQALPVPEIVSAALTQAPAAAPVTAAAATPAALPSLTSFLAPAAFLAAAPPVTKALAGGAKSLGEAVGITGGFKRDKSIDEILAGNVFEQQLPGFGELQENDQRKLVQDALAAGLITGTTTGQRGRPTDRELAAFIPLGAGSRTRSLFLTDPGSITREGVTLQGSPRFAGSLEQLLQAIGSAPIPVLSRRGEAEGFAEISQKQRGALQNLIDQFKSFQRGGDRTQRPTTQSLKDVTSGRRNTNQELTRRE